MKQTPLVYNPSAETPLQKLQATDYIDGMADNQELQDLKFRVNLLITSLKLHGFYLDPAL